MKGDKYMFEKRIAEIEARKAEISTEIQEADEAAPGNWTRRLTP